MSFDENYVPSPCTRVCVIDPVSGFCRGCLRTLDEIAGGSPYGATTIAGGDGSRQPSAIELEGARFQGRHVAEIAAKLHG